MAGILKLTTNYPEFAKHVERYAAAAMITFEEAMRMQGRELAARLMKFTPPLSGKSIKRGLWNRNIEAMASYKQLLIAESRGDMAAAFEKFAPFRDAEIEDMSAKKVGERRVEKDIRKVIKGVSGATLPKRMEDATVIVSQTNPRAATHDVQIDWGVRQKCQGKDAIRIYADRSGNVYGVDTEKFMPNPSNEQLSKVHESHRGKRGRVTTAGSKDLVVGRWRWLNIAVAPEANVLGYIKKKLLMVGQAKGGWAAAFMAMGGKLSTKGWTGRHAKAGTCKASFQRGNVNISMTNNSAWAGNGDPDRVIENAMGARERDMEAMIARILQKRWGEHAAKFDKATGQTKI